MFRESPGLAVTAVSIICCIILMSCSASEDTMKEILPQPSPQPSATEMMTLSMNNLKTQNDSLKLQIANLEQTNRTTRAHEAELETQIAELTNKLSAPPPALPKIKTADTRAMYENALHLFRERNYQEAAATLHSVLDSGTPAELMDNCHYWLGECAYATKNYREAIEHFQKVFTFKISEKKDDAQIMIANCYFAMGDKMKAKEAYKKFLEKFPASPYAKRAKDKLNKL